MHAYFRTGYPLGVDFLFPRICFCSVSFSGAVCWDQEWKWEPDREFWREGYCLYIYLDESQHLSVSPMVMPIVSFYSDFLLSKWASALFEIQSWYSPISNLMGVTTWPLTANYKDDHQLYFKMAGAILFLLVSPTTHVCKHQSNIWELCERKEIFDFFLCVLWQQRKEQKF